MNKGYSLRSHQESRKGLYFPLARPRQLCSNESGLFLNLTDCIVKISNVSWRRNVNDYVKKNLHVKEPLNRNHGDQNNLEEGRLIFAEDYKNGSNHQTTGDI